MTATISITGDAAAYTFSAYADSSCAAGTATVRFYFDTKLILGAETSFQSGLYADQLWWSDVSISLADLFTARPDGVTLSVSFDPENWSNVVGTSGDDLVGTYASDFSLAASSVSRVGFSFGSPSCYAFGDGSTPAGALFNVLEFSYTP